MQPVLTGGTHWRLLESGTDTVWCAVCRVRTLSGSSTSSRTIGYGPILPTTMIQGNGARDYAEQVTRRKRLLLLTWTLILSELAVFGSVLVGGRL